MYSILYLTLIINLGNFHWEAKEGDVVIRSGIAVGGQRICPEGKGKCSTPTGTFQVISKDVKTFRRSSLYPVECNNKKMCGAKMYYFTRITWRGTGIHGTNNPLILKHKSHGCIRVSKSDAFWINRNVPIGTSVIVLPY